MSDWRELTDEEVEAMRPFMINAVDLSEQDCAALRTISRNCLRRTCRGDLLLWAGADRGGRARAGADRRRADQFNDRAGDAPAFGRTALGFDALASRSPPAAPGAEAARRLGDGLPGRDIR
jgi:hypothetical protein